MIPTDRLFFRNSAEKALVSWFQTIGKESGVLAVYLWGSILRDDFDAEISDIDSLAIVNDASPKNLAQETRKIFSTLLPNFADFKINTVYKSELDGGPIHSGLASVLTAELLLIDFPYWKWIIGEKFTVNDFLMPMPSLNEAVATQLKILDQCFLTLTKEDNYSSINYMRKNICHLCYYVQKIRTQKDYPFSYFSLLDYADFETKWLSETLVALRPGTYSISQLRGLFPSINQEIDSLRKYAH